MELERTLARSGLPGVGGSFRRTETAGFVAAGLALLFGLLTERFVAVSALLAGLCIFLYCAPSIRRSLILLILVQVMLTRTVLDGLVLPLPLLWPRVDEFIGFWILALWLFRFLDDDPDTRGTGSLGLLLSIFLAVVLLAGVQGLLRGNNRDAIGYFLKTYAGYLTFFPALWLVRKDRGIAFRLLEVIVAVSVLTGLGAVFVGISGAGAGAHIGRTGMRVISRQTLVVGLGFLIVLARLYLRSGWRIRILPAMLCLSVTGAAVLLSQTRGLWVGILAAVLSGVLIGSSGRGRDRPLIVRILVPALVFLLIAAVLILGVGSVSAVRSEDIAARASTIGGSPLSDTSFLARLFVWSAAIEELSDGALFFGKGLGYEFTAFSPDLSLAAGELIMRTHWWIDGSLFQVALDMGLVGVAAFVALFAGAFVVSLKGYMSSSDDGERSLLLITTACLVFLVVSSFSVSCLTNYRFTSIWGMLMAIIMGLTQKRRQAPEPDGR